MREITIRSWQSPVGEMILGEYEGKLCLADWRYRTQRAVIDRRIQKGLHSLYTTQGTSAVIDKAIKQMEEYFAYERKSFDIPLLTVGSDFQVSVWEKLRQIPYGTTLSYAYLAQQIGRDKAVRAVASAVGANAISILIPCHRIIGSKGDLVGYAGGLDMKKRLLLLEEVQVTL